VRFWLLAFGYWPGFASLEVRALRLLIFPCTGERFGSGTGTVNARIAELLGSANSQRPTANGSTPHLRYLRPLFFHNTTWGRPGFDSGYVVRASMQSDDGRLFKTRITP